VVLLLHCFKTVGALSSELLKDFRRDLDKKIQKTSKTLLTTERKSAIIRKSPERGGLLTKQGNRTK